MSLQYAPRLPIDASGKSMQEFPAPIKAKIVTAIDNASVSSYLGLGHDTTAVEVAAVTTGAGVRWLSSVEGVAAPAGSVITAAGTANFDHYVPAGTVRRFVVPIDKIPVPSIQGVNRANGLMERLAFKSSGVGSVLLTEY